MLKFNLPRRSDWKKINPPPPNGGSVGVEVGVGVGVGGGVGRAPRARGAKGRCGREQRRRGCWGKGRRWCRGGGQGRAFSLFGSKGRRLPWRCGYRCTRQGATNDTQNSNKEGKKQQKALRGFHSDSAGLDISSSPYARCVT